MAGEGGGLAGDAFHHASISAKRVDIEVDQVLEARTVVSRGQPLPGNSHANACGDALAERSRGGFNARRPAVLRMPRTPAIQLPECLDGVQWHRYFAESFVVFADGSDFGQVKQGI